MVKLVGLAPLVFFFSYQYNRNMGFQKGLLSKALSWVKPQTASAVSEEATKLHALRRLKNQGTPYVSLEPNKINRGFNVSGFQRGSQLPKKT